MMKQNYYIQKSSFQQAVLLWFGFGIVVGLVGGLGLGRLIFGTHNTNPPKTAAMTTPVSSPLANTAAVSSPVAPPPAPQERVEYVVQPGDSLSKIAVKFGTTVDALMFLNNLDDSNKVKLGQKLVVKDKLPDVIYAKVSSNILNLMQSSPLLTSEKALMTATVFDSQPVVALSPNGRFVLYTESPVASTDKGAVTWVSNIDGSNKMILVAKELSLPKALGQMWSPDSAAILYSSANNLWWKATGKDDPKPVASDLKVVTTAYPRYAFSPDSKQVVYLQSGSGSEALVVHNLVTGKNLTVWSTTEQQIQEVHWPLDTGIYYVAGPKTANASLEVEVYTIKPFENSKPTPITNNLLPESSLTFVPGSQDFAFAVDNLGVASRAAEMGIWFYSNRDKTQTQLYSDSKGGDSPLVFRFENNMLYFQDRHGNLSILYAVDMTNKTLSSLTRGRDYFFFDTLAKSSN